VFIELMPLLKQRTLLITVARIDEKLKVNVIPAKAKEGEDEALTTPLSYIGSPEELDTRTRPTSRQLRSPRTTAFSMNIRTLPHGVHLSVG
jgi:PRTRC genetic system protein E